MAENEEELINHLQAQQTGNLELLAKQVVEGFITGLHKSPFHGFSVEFAEHRLYNTGESTRHIDWKLLGRTDKMFVKKYEEETNLRCQLIIDNSSSMHYPERNSPKDPLNKIQFSVNCAAAIMYMLKRQRDAVGVSIFSDAVEVHTPAKSTTRHHKLLVHEFEKVLASHEADINRKSAVADALHQIAEHIHKRALVIIFSDMMDNTREKTEELFAAMQHLKHNKHEVVLFHVVDKKKEINFEFENRPYIFIDMETGEQVKAHANEIKEKYLQSMKEYKKDLMLKCAQYRIDFVEADIHAGYKQVLMPYLIKREKMQK